MKAAAKVKTITHIIDTIKELVQFGAAVLREHITGGNERTVAVLPAVTVLFAELSAALTENRYLHIHAQNDDSVCREHNGRILHVNAQTYGNRKLYSATQKYFPLLKNFAERH
jgi:hypothetical protein